ncbi:DUF2125 domain-containing protein [Aureimonas psammosilenae]|uniref:DUF2125 domain-containing protein n=1 Tax=Aureimonas psammosilenae TaxID=2495496 RepID=UPI00126118A4|nr:DUF2125 domain-containing protein [Aureimonas psammosilenae]
MAASSARTGGRAGRVFVGIGLVVIILAALLSGAWYYLANRLDVAVRQAIEAAAGGGTELSCDGQEVFGYPFRLGLRCGAIAVAAPTKGVKASAGALRTAAQIYDPAKVVGELDGPLLLEAPGTSPLDIRWSLLQASTHFWTQGVDRLSVAVDKPDVALAGPAGARQPFAVSDRLEVHARRNGEDLDFAFSDENVRLAQPGLEAIPAFSLGADLSVAGVADWLGGERPGVTLAQALRSRSGTIRALVLTFAAPASGSAEIAGPFSFDGEGRLSGRFDISLTDPAAIADLAGRLVPGAEGIAGTVASGIGLVGRTENGRTVLQVDVRDGRASLGFIPLGRIPPIE